MERMMRRFETKELLEDSLATDLLNVLKEAIDKFGTATLFVSGGSTPKGLFHKLSEKPFPWSKVTIGLVDERFVNSSSEFSNEKLLRETLLQNEVQKARFLSMIYDDKDEIRNLEFAQSVYRTIERIDAIILGMGDDGHTASIFPNDSASDFALITNQPLVSTKAPNYPINRISCSLNFLKKANKTFLFFTGEKKLNVLNESKAKNYPVFHLYNENTQFYYSN
jgi:6-phosphogluconolactonase